MGCGECHSLQIQRQCLVPVLGPGVVALQRLWVFWTAEQQVCLLE